jgi:hypothetical protein
VKSFAPWLISIVAIVIAVVAILQTPHDTSSDNEVRALRERVAVLESVEAADPGPILADLDVAETAIEDLNDMVVEIRSDLDITADYLDSVDDGMVDWSSTADGRITDVEYRVDAIESCVLSIANQLRQRNYDSNAC